MTNHQLVTLNESLLRRASAIMEEVQRMRGALGQQPLDWSISDWRQDYEELKKDIKVLK